MTINKRRKSSRGLGSNTYGWGKNQHRGAGTRGGRGNAGSGKKAHCKETFYWGKIKYLGKRGFFSKGRTTEKIINLKQLEDKLPKWIKEKKGTEKAGTIIVDLTALGYTKILGTGKLTKKLHIKIAKSTQEAKEKIKAAGGELIA